MKKLLVALVILVTFLSVNIFADQVIAKFETDTDGYADNGWGTGLTAVAIAADPDAAQSDMALKLDFSGVAGERGLIAKSGVNPGGALLMTYWVWLPTDIPDSVRLIVWGQDKDWHHVEVEMAVADLPKEVWYPVNFNIAELTVADNGYSGIGSVHQISGIGITRREETDADANWVGSIYVDDVSLVGAYPTVLSDFEAGLGSFENTGWGAGFVSLTAVTDPAATETDNAMELAFNGANGDNARIYWAGGITPSATDLLLFTYVYLPTGTPDGIQIEWVSQDVNWGDEKSMGALASDIPKDTWWPITFNFAAFSADPSSGFDKGTLQWVGLRVNKWNVAEADANWAGSIYFDDAMVLGTNETLPPLIASTLTAALKDSTDLQGEVHHYVLLEFSEQPEHTQAKYDVYFAESAITNVTAAGVHHLQNLGASGESSTKFGHEFYSADGSGTKTYHYAVVVTEADSSKFDATLSTATATQQCNDALDIPLLDEFDFAADGNLSEFEAVAVQFPDMVLRPQLAGSDHEGYEYTIGNTDFDFTGYIVMTHEAMYWGFEVIDNEAGADQLWRGDGVDPFFGLYNILEDETILTGTNAQAGWMRFGVSAREDDKVQWDGYDNAFDVPGIVVNVSPKGFGSLSFIVEWSFRFDSLATFDNGSGLCKSFTPAAGMMIPFKLDVNDRDTLTYSTQGRDHQLSWGCMESAGWPNPFGWASRAAIVSGGSAIDNVSNVPMKFELANAYPNPFNPTTNISFQVPHQEDVALVIYNVLGQKVKTLVNKSMNTGEYNITWDATDMFGSQVSSGIYFVRMQAGDFVKIRKLTLMR